VDADITAWRLRVGWTYPCAPISAEPARGSAMAGVGQGSDPDSLLMARTGSTLEMVHCDMQHDDLDNILQEMFSKRPPKLASGPNPFGIETRLRNVHGRLWRGWPPGHVNMQRHMSN
jgi:hypothetical protein